MVVADKKTQEQYRAEPLRLLCAHNKGNVIVCY